MWGERVVYTSSERRRELLVTLAESPVMYKSGSGYWVVYVE